MTVDEAVKQLQFINKKGAVIVQQAILEAQNLAVKEHNVEFKSNLWVSESFVGRGLIIKGIVNVNFSKTLQKNIIICLVIISIINRNKKFIVFICFL